VNLTRRHAWVGVWIGCLALVVTAAPGVASAAAPATTPTITAPADGDVLSSAQLAVTATSTAGSVLFQLDGRTQYQVELPVVGGEASGQLSVAGLDGPMTLAAYDCSGVTPGDCNTASGASVAITVSLPAPVITSPSSGVVVGASVVVSATAPTGAVRFLVDTAQRAVDTTAPFKQTVSLSSLTQGPHDLTVRQCNADATVCEGAVSAPVTVVKDTRGPVWSDLSSTPTTVYPYRDRYRDSTRLRARVGEPSRGVTATVRNRAGRTVRTLRLGSVGAGVASVSWNGRAAGGQQVPRGRYTFQFAGRDLNGAASSSRKGVVLVSDQRLVRQSATRTVTANDSGLRNISGTCSGVYLLSSRTPAPKLREGLGYYSNSKCRGSGSDDVAAALHGLRLTSAARYGSVRVDVYGGAAARRGGPGVLGYVTPAGKIKAARQIGQSLSWHRGPTASLSPFVNGRAFIWLVATANGSWYNVGSFRVTYSYFVLRSP
jgi:hypothetical protein